MPPCIGVSNWNLAIFPVFKMCFTSKIVYMYIYPCLCIQITVCISSYQNVHF